MYTVTRKYFAAGFFAESPPVFSAKYIYLLVLILRTDKCRNAFSIAQRGILRVLILRIRPDRKDYKIKTPANFFRVTVVEHGRRQGVEIDRENPLHKIQDF
jgi:hypothetical protein